ALDLRDGTLTRTLLWLTPTGNRVRIETRRMVSFADRHLATLEMRVTVLDDDADLTISSLIINRQDLDRVTREVPGNEDGMTDPRKSERLEQRVLDLGPMLHDARRSVLSYRVRNSKMALGVGVDH